MFENSRCQLTTKDYSLIEVKLERLPASDPLVPLLRRKLASATVVFREDIPAGVVTLNSRVTYRLADGTEETRTIVLADHAPSGEALPVATPRGLALLGAQEGDILTVEHFDGTREPILVKVVAFQPETALRDKACLPGEADRPVRADYPSGGAVIAFRPPQPQQQITGTDFPDPDDPGPAAA
ncbi:hypothetical protein GCM10007276_31920 [Agaricicola taiwanensis]|uniref:Transcription elongation factor GreA/GreB C-terminal domain-containing protein n=1 Tax=Agaricicola taiwanensis TaxID=591372 RepID=A0A8J2YLI6_9RHOB|nr:GreA/GreB family elongation factor [Agaricicola taiwanensis]GGE52507.1 hypothetical protein GCM10007276_31920 [Agaricicola taiwanensis]